MPIFRKNVDDRPAETDHVPPSRKHTDVEVFCLKCGDSVGYVVRDGHRDWLCEDCGDGRMIATTREEHGHPPEGTYDARAH